MDWNIIGGFVGMTALLGSLLIYVLNRLESDISAIGRRLDGHATRIDQLYSIIVDLLKEKK